MPGANVHSELAVARRLHRPQPIRKFRARACECEGANACAFILQPRLLRARYYLPSLRDSDASTLRTSDWEIPNCLAMREGVMPALKLARTALTWPRVNATLGSCGCRRSGDSSVVVD